MHLAAQVDVHEEISVESVPESDGNLSHGTTTESDDTEDKDALPSTPVSSAEPAEELVPPLPREDPPPLPQQPPPQITPPPLPLELPPVLPSPPAIPSLPSELPQLIPPLPTEHTTAPPPKEPPSAQSQELPPPVPSRVPPPSNRHPSLTRKESPFSKPTLTEPEQARHNDSSPQTHSARPVPPQAKGTFARPIVSPLLRSNSLPSDLDNNKVAETSSESTLPVKRLPGRLTLPPSFLNNLQALPQAPGSIPAKPRPNSAKHITSTSLTKDGGVSAVPSFTAPKYSTTMPQGPPTPTNGKVSAPVSVIHARKANNPVIAPSMFSDTPVPALPAYVQPRPHAVIARVRALYDYTGDASKVYLSF